MIQPHVEAHFIFKNLGIPAADTQPQISYSYRTHTLSFYSQTDTEQLKATEALFSYDTRCIAEI